MGVREAGDHGAGPGALVPGGVVAARTVAGHGVDTVFSLNGGHVWPFYDGCVQEGIRLVDTRHEQSAAFAAEAWAKVTRRVGVAALTAGPGVTNGISAMTTAWLNGSPVFVLGGRAPQARWGQGSLQELDHVPLVAPVTKHAATCLDPAALAAAFDTALVVARTPHRGPTFLDVPLDGWSPIAAAVPAPPSAAALAGDEPDADAVSRVAALVAESRRPVLLVGGDVYWAGAEVELRAFVEAAVVPAFANDMGRGMLPADHELAFARTRASAFGGADLVIVAGTPLDFRLGFGRFGTAAVVHLADTASGVATGVDLAASAAGDLKAMFATLADAAARTGAGPATRRAGRASGFGSRGCATRSAPVASRRSPGSPRTPTPSSRRASTASSGPGSNATRSSSATAGTSSRTPASTSTRSSRGRSSARVRTGAWGSVSGTPWAPRSRSRRARSSRCSATARSASHSATSTRWRDTART